ncbi:MAG: c-type cytochrome [Verrucomicrobia bacterium]|nr:c-type cytochrome [Verrucomicrobiota bacterium]
MLAAALLAVWSSLCVGRVHAAEGETVGQAARTAIAIEALSRLKSVDLEANAALKAAVLKVVEQVRGKPQFVELVRDFKIKGQGAALLEIAIKHADNATGVEALRLVLENQESELIKNSLAGTNAGAATKIAEALGNVGENQIVPLLAPLVNDPARDVTLRKQAVRALTKNQEGAAALLKLAKEDKLPADVKLVASAELNGVRWPNLKAEAAQLLPLPQSQNAEALPPVSELVKRNGDPIRGAEIFRRETVGCSKCHQVGTDGINFGPALSEIGTKLAREAIYESILDPSAGISFGFEAFQLELKNGDEAYGLIASETADELALKAQGGIITRYKKSDITKKEQQKLSAMPAGLQQTMTTQELVDLVEYLATLKKAEP